MNRTTLDPSMNPELQRVLQFIMDGALGSMITLSSDPTTAGMQMKPNQIGFNPTTSNLFLSIGSNTYKVALTLV